MTQPCDDGKPGWALRRGSFDDATADAYETFLREVFDGAPLRSKRADPYWEPWAYVDTTGRCIAGLELATLDLVVDQTAFTAAALRLVGVAETHRGRGLFRDLLGRALTCCDARGPTLLYTETQALYTPFGFAPLAQHAFVGPAPTPAAGVQPADRVDADRARTLIDRFVPSRTPVSWHCALSGGGDLLFASLDDDDLALAYAADLDALLVHEQGEDEITIVDVVAATMPSMAEIVAALRVEGRRLRVLFPPDRLGWQGNPERDETGLMIRGTVPEGMRRPFMLPPTTSF